MSNKRATEHPSHFKESAMNRFLILAASLSLAAVTISSTCLAQPADIAGIASRPTSLASGQGIAAFSLSASLGPSLMAGEGRLSL
jgi:hypothetical protein